MMCWAERKKPFVGPLLGKMYELLPLENASSRNGAIGRITDEKFREWASHRAACFLNPKPRSQAYPAGNGED